MIEKGTFALVAFVFCLLLSFRPIPNTSSSNDTGRYVDDLRQYCQESISDRLSNGKISDKIYYVVTSPACLARSDRVFLFEASVFLPLMFLLYFFWHRGTFPWACSLLFSIFGLELMTNAMRQCFAMFLFFGAVALVRKRLVHALLLGALASATHVTALIYFPLLLWISRAPISRKGSLIVFMLALLTAMIVGVAYQSFLIECFHNIDELRMLYTIKYADELKPSFLLFMTLPLFFVYGLRCLLEKQNVSMEEKKGFIYSTAVLVLSFLFFPYITYRFAMFAVPLQIYFVSISENHRLEVGCVALVGFLAHTMFMFFATNHFNVLFYG